MADFEKQNRDELLKSIINETINSVGTENINQDTQENIKELNPDSVVENKLPTSELKSFVRSLPENEKDDVLRYLDIFRNNNAPVVSYIEDIKKYGSVKKAKEAGATSGLLNPNKFLKEFSKEGDEEDLSRFTSNLILGNEIYDQTKRDDFVGQQRQKEYLSSKKTKAMRGVGMAMEESARETFRTIAAMTDAGFNTEMLDFLEQNWPAVEKSRAGVEQLAEDLTQLGISFYGGKKIINLFGKISKKVAPDFTRNVVKRLQKGKVAKDKSGNIKVRSSIAQKAGYWGVGGAVAYGIGEVVTGGSEDDKTILGDVQPLGIGTDKLRLEDTEGLSGRDKATKVLKNKLKYGADGTALVGGLTIAGKTVAMPVLRAGNKLLLAPTFRGIGKGLDVLSKVAASEKTGIPQLTRKIIESKNKALTKAGIPKMDDWQFFSVTAGPLKERVLKVADDFFRYIRTRGSLTAEAKDLLIKSEGLVNKYRKRVDMKMKQLENKIYTLTEKSLVDKIITDATPVAAKGYLDDIVLYLQGKIGINDLPQVLRNSSKEVKTVIDDLTKELQPYIKSGQLEKEFIDNIGKYLRNSYEIFRSNSFKPNSSQIKSATDYFKEQIKRMDPEYKNVKIGSGTDLDNQLSRFASSKVDEILNVGQEGSNPKERIKAITSVVAPFLDKKNPSLPKVVQDLLGKVNDPRAIVLDTVTQQANLLAHIRYHKALLRNGLKNNWIFKDEKDFIRRGFQKEVAPSLVPITVSKNRMNVDLTDVYSYKIGKARAPYYTTKEIAQAMNGDNLVTDFLLKIPMYKAYLAAKTTSQLSKTVLSLMTQMRNVETAAFFSFINGHMGRNASVIDSMKIAFQDVIGKGNVKPEVMKKKLEEYLQYGVFDNSVVAGEVEAVLKDIVKNRFSTSEQLMKYLLNNPVFRKATEFYQASDNLWKAYGYEFTKSQMVPAIPIKGLSLDDAAKLGYKIEPGRKTAYTWQDLVTQQYKEIFNMKWDPLDFAGNPKTYSQALRDIASKYTRDVYPNYSMVPQIVKEWRRLPLGNFVAFQSEIIRNIYNILTYSTREISSSNPYIRQIGARRLMGFGSVMYGFDKGLEGISSRLTGLDEEFIKGYQRFFSPWYAKNDKIIPVSKPDKDGKFQSIDWSKEQPFASITDGFNTFTEGMFNPDKSDEAMFTRFFKSMFYDYEEKKNGALTQIFEPFITESILTEAILDVSPKWMPIPGARGGETKEGKRIYDAANEPYDVVVGKIFNHLIQTINPTTFRSAGKVLSAYDEEVN
jgi:hypothetical protein